MLSILTTSFNTNEGVYSSLETILYFFSMSVT